VVKASHSDAVEYHDVYVLLLLLLLLQDDVSATTDAVTSDNYQLLSSTAADNHHDDASVSDRTCQQGIVKCCRHFAVAATEGDCSAYRQ